MNILFIFSRLRKQIADRDHKYYNF